MNKKLDIAKNELLKPTELTIAQLQNILDSISINQIDYADIYFQASCAESWGLEEGIVKQAIYSIDRGVGIRAVSGEKTGFAYTSDLILPSLKKAANAAKTIAKTGKTHQVYLPKMIAGLELYDAVNPLNLFSESDKVALLQEIDQMARSQDPRVSQVMVNLSSNYDVILIMSSDGTLAADIRPLMRLGVSVLVEDKSKKERGVFKGGGRDQFDYASIKKHGLLYAREAVRQALLNLEAKPAPAGTMPVILGAGLPGILLHEAIGHGLESDFNRKGTSAFAGRIGEQIASPLCTIVDDGTLKGTRGSLNIDDEGVPSQYTVLIEKGVLKNYMFDKLNARLMNAKTTANARRQSYADLPMPRMTNTYMLAGDHDPEEIIRSVDKGLYAVGFSSGQVNITSGDFVFSTSEAYLIEKGKIKHPVKGATLIGNGPEVLKKVSMVGNKLEIDRGVGTCGKAGQSVPVIVGQPMIKVDELTVGGIVG